jgi:signal peptidase II
MALSDVERASASLDERVPPEPEPPEDEALDDDDEGATADRAKAWRGPSIARWVLFGVIAVGVVVADQAAKGWIVGNLDVGEGFDVLGDWLRIVHGRNSGILFGMLPQSAPAFAIVSMVVAGLIVAYHAKAGRGLVVTIALALLLGGALGNLLDRLRYGSVIDFVDMGIGAWRFYTYNVADAAISTAIVLLMRWPPSRGWAIGLMKECRRLPRRVDDEELEVDDDLLTTEAPRSHLAVDPPGPAACRPRR